MRRLAAAGPATLARLSCPAAVRRYCAPRADGKTSVDLSRITEILTGPPAPEASEEEKLDMVADVFRMLAPHASLERDWVPQVLNMYGDDLTVEDLQEWEDLWLDMKRGTPHQFNLCLMSATGMNTRDALNKDLARAYYWRVYKCLMPRRIADTTQSVPALAPIAALNTKGRTFKHPSAPSAPRTLFDTSAYLENDFIEMFGTQGGVLLPYMVLWELSGLYKARSFFPWKPLLGSLPHPNVKVLLPGDEAALLDDPADSDLIYNNRDAWIQGLADKGGCNLIRPNPEFRAEQRDVMDLQLRPPPFLHTAMT
eukprot:gene2782-3403_t